MRRYPLVIAWFIFTGYLGFVAWSHYSGHVEASRGGVPLFTDFTPNYAASMMLRVEPAENLYQPELIGDYHLLAANAAYSGRLTGEQAHMVGNTPWMYPPTFNLYIAFLAYLPYLIASLAWCLLTAIPFLATINSILPGRLAWPLALAAPPTFFNLMYGQTGFLSAGLIGLGLCHLRTQPYLAGILIGLASFKPHLGVLIPLALLAGGYWKTVTSASLTVLASVVASIAFYGDSAWLGIIGSAPGLLEGFAANTYNYKPMTTVLATLAMAGMPLQTAWAVQLIFSVIMAAVVVVTWRRGRERPDTLGLQTAILCCATPLAVPMLFLYDLVLLIPAVAWTWQHMRVHGCKPWVEIALFGILGATILVKFVSETMGLQLGALLVAAMLMLILQRYRSALAEPWGER